MKIKNIIVLIAIGLFGTFNTQAKSNYHQNKNKFSQIQKQDPPEKNFYDLFGFDLFTLTSSDDGGGIIYDFNPPIYEPPYPVTVK